MKKNIYFDENIGERITYCRSLMGKTRKELCSEWGYISVPTLVRWELGETNIPLKKIKPLIEHFLSNDIVVEQQWLLLGLGIPPLNSKINDLTEEGFDEITGEIYLNLNKKIKNFFSCQITENYFAPLVRYGDYIGGINIEIKNSLGLSSLLNKLIYVVSETRCVVGYCLKIDSGKVFLNNVEGKICERNIAKLAYMGEVQWITKRP